MHSHVRNCDVLERNQVTKVQIPRAIRSRSMESRRGCIKRRLFFGAFSIRQNFVGVLFEDACHAVAGGSSEHEKDRVLVIEAQNLHDRTVLQ